MLKIKEPIKKLSLNLSPKLLAKIENKKRVARRSRGKGRRGENGVAEVFNEWIQVPQTFSPTSSSGAGRLIGQAGDLLAPLGFIFCVEIKNDESWKLGDFLTDKLLRTRYGKIWDFWEQCTIACSKYQNRKQPFQVTKVPALIFTKNKDSYFIMLDRVDIYSKNLKMPPSHLNLYNEHFGIFYIFELTEFLWANTPEILGVGNVRTKN
jgi:hypothetical protein